MPARDATHAPAPTVFSPAPERKPRSNTKKIVIGVVVLVVLAALVALSVRSSQSNVTSVTTSKVVREDLSSVVTGSGEIKAKTYVNIGAQGFGKITQLYVKEGASVKKGQRLAQLENVQSAADVNAQQATIETAQKDLDSADAQIQTSVAEVARDKADLEQKTLDYKRAQELYSSKLISKSDFDAKKAAYDVAAATLNADQAKVAQAKAQMASSSGRVSQARAMLRKLTDVLGKTEYVAPFDGIVTNLPVREGETVVIGIQNSPGSTLMTLADMSVVTAEVRVDETDIVNVKLGEAADVTIDAIPDQVFKGRVTEIGDQALVRSSGVATSQTTAGTQEAKDFKVVVTLDNPPSNLRPGFSTTAKITTASKNNVLAIPIQALTVRTQGELDAQRAALAGKKGSSASPAPPSVQDAKSKKEVQGVFVVDKSTKKVDFKPVQTGIQGATDVEVTSGANEGQEIVTGSYKVLRTLKIGTKVKVDNSIAKKDDNS
ncbi:MAG: efflux RND transporter periplasmic adaptor subunit [Acidobacteria bacterium]|nr:efflux RND transporter periplasmic adaptor subunit [Acidobacteriota bacterium]MBV9146222.1 efflux RND transporter periplasmic adaptor subunit [Acidobacteriota bacterium]